MRLGIIGIGYWGKHYIRIVNNSQRVILSAICDLNKNVLDKFKNLNIKIFTDYSEMFKSKLIDGIIIVTISKTHYSIIKEALKYNLKIFVEKPYTLSFNNCNEINLLIRKSNKLMVGHTYLFNSKINFIKDFLKKKNSDVKSINFEWTCYGPIRTDTTPIFDLAVHPLSILYYLFPDSNVSNISSIKSVSGHTYFINFKFNKIIIFLNIAWSSPGKIRKMTINTDKMKLICDDVSNLYPVKIYEINKPNYNSSLPNNIFNDGDIQIPQITNNEPLTEQFNHWLDYIENKCKCLSDENFSTKIIKLMETIEKLSI